MAGVIPGLLVVALVVGWIAYDRRKRAGGELPLYRQRISEVGRSEGGGIACPACGGSQFTARRSMGGKAIAGLLAPKTVVECVTCGARYRRG